MLWYGYIIHYLSSIISLIIMVIIYKNMFKDVKINIKVILIILLFSFLSTINTLLNYTFSKILIFYFLYVICLYFTFKDKIKNLITRSIFIYLTVMIVEVFVGIIMIIFPFSNILEVNNDSLFKLVISLLIMLISLLIFYIRLFKDLIKEIVNFFDNKDILFNVLVVTIIIFLISCITFKNALNYKSVTYLIINIITLICFILILSVCLYNIIMRKKAEDKEEILLNFIKKYEFIIDKDRINRHEMLNNLLVLKSFKNKGSKEYLFLLDNFIKEYKTTTSNVLKNLYKLPSGLKGIIYYKLYDMEKEGIKTFIKISSRSVSKLDKMEVNIYSKICKIVGILLDNAIESAKACNNKNISIDMYENKDNISIEIINTATIKEIDLSRINEKNYSSKGKNRGYGLYLVNRMINSTNKLELEQKILNNTFVSILKINLL